MEWGKRIDIDKERANGHSRVFFNFFFRLNTICNQEIFLVFSHSEIHIHYFLFFSDPSSTTNKLITVSEMSPAYSPALRTLSAI